MKYTVKDTVRNLITNEINYIYPSNDGFYHEFEKYAKRFTKNDALKYIKKEMEPRDWIKIISENEYVERDIWLHHYEIIEVAD